jgi:hypothetical protein
MSGGGSLGPIASSGILGPQGQAAPTPTPSAGAAYTPVQQGPVYRPQYQAYQPQARAAQPQQMPNYQSGLQAAMMQMMQQYSRPMMRAPMQQGLQPSSALTYRPNMSGVSANLNRVAPSVELQQKQAAEAAARQAAIDAANAPSRASDGASGE